MMSTRSATAFSRLEPLPTLPIFFKLAGKRALVVGGSPPAAWKAELLAAAGAQVDVVDPEPCRALEELANDLGGSAVKLVRRHWREQDLAAAAIAIGAIGDEGEAARFQQAAHAAGVPVNVIDKPSFCDFQFGTLVVRSPLVLAITTDGAAPVLGQALRARLEALLPATLRAWAATAKAWRPQVAARRWDFGRRRRFWEAVAERALAANGGAPDLAALEACLAEAEASPATKQSAVAFVGCGQGTPDELTLAAVRVLQNAEVVVHETGLRPDTVQMARRESEKVEALTDEHALAGVLAALREGHRVVWLGTGNPASCLRWRRRRTLLQGHVSLLDQVAGLAQCSRCQGRCDGSQESMIGRNADPRRAP